MAVEDGQRKSEGICVSVVKREAEGLKSSSIMSHNKSLVIEMAVS